ncbi:MAG: hypothetical protein V1899_02865 [Planctomycetota bacterium]
MNNDADDTFRRVVAMQQAGFRVVTPDESYFIYLISEQIGAGLRTGNSFAAPDSFRQLALPLFASSEVTE